MSINCILLCAPVMTIICSIAIFETNPAAAATGLLIAGFALGRAIDRLISEHKDVLNKQMKKEILLAEKNEIDYRLDDEDATSARVAFDDIPAAVWMFGDWADEHDMPENEETLIFYLLKYGLINKSAMQEAVYRWSQRIDGE